MRLNRHTATLLNLLDSGLSPDQLMEAGRLHYSDRWDLLLDQTLTLHPEVAGPVETLLDTARPKAFLFPDKTISLVLENLETLGPKLFPFLEMLDERGVLIQSAANTPGIDPEALVFTFYSVSEPMTVLISGVCVPGRRPEVTEFSIRRKVAGQDEYYNSYPERLKAAGSVGVVLIELLVLFHRFFQTEKQVLVADRGRDKYRRVKTHSQQFESNLPYPVNVVDSSWFTSILRSDPFMVQGHFRMQACGPGHKDRKLVWIESFTKQGYSRKAKNVAA